MSEDYGENHPIIGVIQWAPGARPPQVREVAPTVCPFEGHDITTPRSLSLGHVPSVDGGWRLYTCQACYEMHPERSSWRVASDDDAMWLASGLPRPEGR